MAQAHRQVQQRHARSARFWMAHRVIPSHLPQGIGWYCSVDTQACVRMQRATCNVYCAASEAREPWNSLHGTATW